ncbi:beta-ketoacyl synthase N-terminal-like domain-containing protein [Paenibacillus sp. FSL H7-0350]|uniref:beta-ketoacyl synthase N-terminal-like domain-containing protein n=1 Tax=Paenibacillus sp. FSL H7-0350 TaxID=2975345 RepID=UPI003159182B
MKNNYTGMEIAVIGMSGRFPSAGDLEEFWSNLVDGKEGISFFDKDELVASGMNPELLDMPNFVGAKGVFPNIEYFDADFFNYTHRDAATLDPQVRILHQEVYHALEDAGYVTEQPRNNIGVFLGSTSNFAWELETMKLSMDNDEHMFGTGLLNDKDFAATRIAYSLNLQGPCVTVHSACSTSLYAIDLACRQLLTGACSVAVAGGSSFTVPSRNGYLYTDGMINSPDGHCRPFDQDAKGTVEGNGVGIVVLKRLENAVKDRDHIYAVIRGSAVNNDGNRKVGFTAPSVEGQADVIRRALYMADVPAQSISYIETHGTGTILGDPIEIAGLQKAFQSVDSKSGSIGLGSLKSNIGHLDVGAGVASFIKTSLALKNKIIPASIHFEKLNSNIDFTNTPFRMITESQEWNRQLESTENAEYYPLRAGVSSFGIGGTNVHIILEEAPEREVSGPGREWNVLSLSAATETSLNQMKEDYLTFINHAGAGINPTDLAYSLHTGSRSLKERFSLPYRNYQELSEGLEAAIKGEASQRGSKNTVSNSKAEVIFVFPGQGSQYVGMARDLYQTEQVFCNELEACLKIAEVSGEYTLRRLILDPAANDEEIMKETDLAQLSLFVIEYALARLLMSWGIKPYGMIGHSLGEYTAACLAGVFSIEEGIQLVMARGRLMKSMARGSMLSVSASAAILEHLLPASVSLAAVNSPNQCTVAGSDEDIELVQSQLASMGLTYRRLKTSHAFHSSMMDGMLAEFGEVCAKVAFKEPAIPYVSNLTGDWITPQDATDSSYYTKHVRNCVQFARGIETILTNPGVVFIEVGPGRTLSTFVRQAATEKTAGVVNILRHPNEPLSDDAFLTERLGELWCCGVAPDWKAYYKEQVRNHEPLPHYPFDAKKFPIGSRDTYSLLKGITSGAKHNNASQDIIHKDTGNGAAKVSQVLWEPSFLPQINPSVQQRTSLILTQDVGHAIHLFKSLPKWRGIFVNIGCEYSFNGFYDSAIRPANETDLRRLFKDLKNHAMLPNTIMVIQSDVRSTEEELRVLADVIKEELHDSLPEVVVISPAAIGNHAPGLVTLVRALMTEQPGLVIRLVDAGVPSNHVDYVQQWASVIEKELAVDGSNYPAVSYNNGSRMVPRLRNLDTCEVRQSSSISGSHLVVLSPENRLPIALAQTLQREKDTKVSLLPYRLDSRSFYDETIVQALEDVQAQQQQYMERFGIEDLSGTHRLVDEYSARLVFDYINEVFLMKTGRRFDINTFKEGLGVIDPLARFADYFLHILCEDGLLEAEKDKGSFRVTERTEQLRQPTEIRAEIEGMTDLFSGQLDLLAHCVSKFKPALRGEIPSLGVLYPEGNNELLQRTYEGTLQAKEEELMIEMFAQMLSKLVGEKRRIRILEVGGGFGTILRQVTEVLKGVEVEYLFTDVSSSFLEDIRAYAHEENLEFLTTGLFDITKDPQQQGFEANHFDIVVAYNVVHATHRISESLDHLHRLLKLGGLLCVIERVHTRRFVDLIWGLADGWWHFDESERELSPLISVVEWHRQFVQLGLEMVTAYPDQSKYGALLDVGMLVGRRMIMEETEGLENVILTEEGVTCLPVIAGSDMDSLQRALEATLNTLSNVDGIMLWDALANKKCSQHAVRVAHQEEVDLSIAVNQLITRMDNQKPRIMISSLSQANHWSSELTKWVVANDELDIAADVYRLYLPLENEGIIEELPAVLGAMLESGIRQVILNPCEFPLFSDKPGSVGASSKTKTEIVKVTELEVLEQLLEKSWKGILGREDIGREEDFFAMGGDSFKLIEMTTDLEREGYKLLMNEVYKYPTIHLLAAYMNRQSEGKSNDITTVEQLEAHLTGAFGAKWIFRVLGGEQPVNILFVDEAATGGVDFARQYLQKLHMSEELLPHYIYELSLYEQLSEPIDLGQLIKHGVLFNSEKMVIENVEEHIQAGQDLFNLAVTSQPIINRFDLSNIQEIHFRGEVRLQLYMMQFNEMVDQDLLEQALCDVVGNHQLLRSCLYEYNEGYRWKEYSPPLKLSLPKLDLSGLTPGAQSRVMEEIAKFEWAANFKQLDKPMYHVTLIKMNEKNYNLFFQFDHSIFDISSGQAIRRQILQRYKELQKGVKHAMEAATTYEQYLQQINKGPVGMEIEQLHSMFDLDRYLEYTDILIEKFNNIQENRIQQMRYSIDLSLFNFDEDDANAPFELALQVYALVVARILDLEAVPFDLLFQNRRYEGKNFSDVVGLVLDAVPFIVTADRENPSHVADVIRNTVKNINKHNVNFISLSKNKTIFKEAPATFYSPILLNYGGNAEEEYSQIWDYTMQQLDDKDQKKLNYAGFYGLVGVVKDKLNFLVLYKFDSDMESVRQAFDEEVAQLVEKYNEKRKLKEVSNGQL